MSEARQRLIQALDDAYACEQALVPVLESRAAMAPRGRYRKGLEAHLRETRDHARRIEERLSALRQRDSVFLAGIHLLENALGQGVALGRAPLGLLGKAPLGLLGKGPLGLLRSSVGAERVLASARDACATEALEIARYQGIEALAQSIGDRQTARLAGAIRADEQKMLDLLLDEIPNLIAWIVEADARGKAAAAISANGKAKVAPSPRGKGRRVASRTGSKARKARPPRGGRAAGRARASLNAASAQAGAARIHGAVGSAHSGDSRTEAVGASTRADAVSKQARDLPFGDYARRGADEVVQTPGGEIAASGERREHRAARSGGYPTVPERPDRIIKRADKEVVEEDLPDKELAGS
jgi:ferritin-like metal-binding protein YciE